MVETEEPKPIDNEDVDLTDLPAKKPDNEEPQEAAVDAIEEKPDEEVDAKEEDTHDQPVEDVSTVDESAKLPVEKLLPGEKLNEEEDTVAAGEAERNIDQKSVSKSKSPPKAAPYVAKRMPPILNNDKKCFVKIVAIGDSGVGKTSLIQMFEHCRFTENFKPTIGADFSNREITIDGKVVTL